MKKLVRNLILWLTGLVAVSTGFYYFVEGWSVLDSFYFTVMTITTVGHPGLVGVSSASKLFTSAISITGISILFILFGVVGYLLVRKRTKQ